MNLEKNKINLSSVKLENNTFCIISIFACSFNYNDKDLFTVSLFFLVKYSCLLIIKIIPDTILIFYSKERQLDSL